MMRTDNTVRYPSTLSPTVLTSTEARKKVTNVVTRPGDEARKRGQVGRAARGRRVKMGDSGKFQIFLSTTFQNYFTLSR